MASWAGNTFTWAVACYYIRMYGMLDEQHKKQCHQPNRQDVLSHRAMLTLGNCPISCVTLTQNYTEPNKNKLQERQIWPGTFPG